MPLPPAHQPLSETDYEAIEAAVKETARGRWFLDEYAYRNRNADTRLVLDAIQRLQRSVLGTGTLPPPAQEAPALDKDLSEIEQTAEKTRAALAQMEAARLREGGLGKELDQIAGAQAEAVAAILGDADRLARIAATMRLEGVPANLCEQLDAVSSHIRSACAFQDLAGQRLHKVMLAARVQEARLAALAQLWQAEPAPQADVVIEHGTPDAPAPSAGNTGTGEAMAEKTKTAPLAAAPSAISAKRSDLDRLSFDERLALFT